MAAGHQTPLSQEKLDEHSQLINELEGSVAQLQEMSANMQETWHETNEKLATRIATLELQYSRMKKGVLA